MPEESTGGFESNFMSLLRKDHIYLFLLYPFLYKIN